MLSRRKVFLYKVETTKGTDANPVPANDLILPVGDPSIQIPTDADTAEGEIKGTFGPGQPVVIKQSLGLEIATRVRGLGQGSGALVNPAIHAALMCSGHAVTTAGNGTSTPREATYVPTSVPANLKSGSGYLYEDGLLYKLLGAVNNLKFAASMDTLMCTFGLQAPYAAPTTVALPAWSMPTQEPFRMTSALCTISEGGSAVQVASFEFECGPSVENDYATGQNSYDVTDRAPMISIDPKATASTTDFTRLTNATQIALVATFTNSLGETLVFNAPKAVLVEMGSADRAGHITRQKKFQLVEGSSGDDQYSIKWTAVL